MPCESRVRIWYDSTNKPFQYKVRCSGQCHTGGPDCQEQTMPFHTSGGASTLKYCGCAGEGESKTCHIRLHISRDPLSGAEDTEVQCLAEEACPKEKDKDAKCVIMRGEESRKIWPIPDKHGKYDGRVGRYIDWHCSCIVPGDGWKPEDPKAPVFTS